RSGSLRRLFETSAMGKEHSSGALHAEPGVRDGIIVVGSAGHAKVCIELLRAMGEAIEVCVGGPDAAPTCMGLRVLVGDEHLARLREEGFGRLFVAIGSNGIRDRLGNTAISLGFQLVNAISPLAIISPTAKIGRGVAIMAGAVVNAEAVIEDL